MDFDPITGMLSYADTLELMEKAEMDALEAESDIHFLEETAGWKMIKTNILKTIEDATKSLIQEKDQNEILRKQESIKAYQSILLFVEHIKLTGENARNMVSDPDPE